jgi:CheY-like chemotaxis protein
MVDRRPRVWIVEDVAYERASVRELLLSGYPGARFLEAGTVGQSQGLIDALLDGVIEAPDLIVLDIRLPEEAGVSPLGEEGGILVHRNLRSTPELATVHVLVRTAFVEDFPQAQRDSDTVILSKSAPVETLLASVHSLLAASGLPPLGPVVISEAGDPTLRASWFSRRVLFAGGAVAAFGAWAASVLQVTSSCNQRTNAAILLLVTALAIGFVLTLDMAPKARGVAALAVGVLAVVFVIVLPAAVC